MPLDVSQSQINEIRQLGDGLFDKRSGLLSLWQEMALQFYYERADFTTVQNLGAEMGTNQMTSAPVLARRNMANAFGGMLRPTAKPWNKIRCKRRDKEDTSAKQYLQWLTDLTRNAMYDTNAMLSRACKEADNDFATFGQAAIQCELYRPPDGTTPHLLHRCWHLRDVAWKEDAIGRINTVFRKWAPAALTLKTLFPRGYHISLNPIIEKTPWVEVNCWHVLIPMDVYQNLPGARDNWRQKFVSLFIDIDHNWVMECVPVWVNGYVIPRWQTVSGSQYAHSPSTVAALPDARLLQAITGVLLEAGEKAVNPPMVAVHDVVRGDIPVYAGGVTWVDADYDERTGEALRPMVSDQRNLQFGLELIRDLRNQLGESFFLNKLTLPPVATPGMTAYEVGQRVQEYIRNALPLFEPMEQEYNASLCETDLQLLMHGDPTIARRAPESLGGQDVEFEFESPLREAMEKQKTGQFLESAQIIAQAVQLDQSVAFIPDMQKVTREVLEAVAPASWLRTEDDVTKLIKNAEAAKQQEAMLALMERGSVVAKTTSEATANAAKTIGTAAPAAAPTQPVPANAA